LTQESNLASSNESSVNESNFGMKDNLTENKNSISLISLNKIGQKITIIIMESLISPPSVKWI
jgi:hypothetical protein